tara:strand:+ start:4591 stop:4761 length:171 start_codon:yes stop_codon:yes gene_type:complete
MLSSLEVATLLCCTKRNVIRLVKTKRLQPINTQKKFYLFDETEVLTLKTLRDERKK